MIEIVIDDEVIEIGDEMTICQYQQLKTDEESYKKDKVKMLSLYTGISHYKLKNLPIQQIEFVENYISNNLLTEEYKDETYEKFVHNGIEYGLENDWSKLAWGAWVDLEVYGAEKVDENIHKIMAILYRPVISTTKKGYKIQPYKSEEIDDRANEFRTLPLKYWFGASSFFFLLASLSTNNMLNSLSLKNRLNKLIMIVWMRLPKWIRRKLQPDSILF